MVALLTNTDAEPPTPDQARMIKRVKWLMLLSGFATMLGIVVVLIVAGYRLFHSPAPSGGATEIRSFDAKTLRPQARLRFLTEP